MSWWGGTARAGAALLSATLKLAARPFGAWRIGRLLQIVSLPRLREHPLRTSLTLLGIALGVAMLVAVVIVNDSVLRGAQQTVEDLAGRADLQISGGSSGFDERLLELAQSTPGVARAAPILQQTVTVDSTAARGERLLLLGVDMLTDDAERLRDDRSPDLAALRRDPLPFLNGSNHLLLSRSFARRHGVKVGGELSLLTSAGRQPFEVWGLIDAKGAGAAFGGAVAVMYYQALQVAFARGGNLDRIDVAVSHGRDVSGVQRALAKRFGSGFVIERPVQKGERIGRMLFGLQSGLILASAIALLVGAFLIYNTMGISVAQRKRELGLLRALGSKRSELIALLTLEGALLGAVGSVLGVALGLCLSKALLQLTTQALDQTYLELGPAALSLRLRVLFGGFALGTVAATGASALAARRAALIQPAETLRSAGVVPVREIRAGLGATEVIATGLLVSPTLWLRLPSVQGMPLGAAASAAALLAGCTLLLPRFVQLALRVTSLAAGWLSVEVRLAHESLPRDLGRTASTASALMAGVALSIGFGVFTHSFSVSLERWIAQTLPGDLFITQGATMAGTSARNIPMDDTLYARLRARPEVEGVRRVRIVDLPYAGYTTKAVSSDLDVLARRSRLDLLEGEHAAVVAALQAGDVAISENFARHFHLRAGQHIALSTHDGTSDFRVAGVFVDYTSDVGTLLFDRAQYIRSFHDARVDTYELYLRSPGLSERVRQSIQSELGTSHDLTILTGSEFRQAISQTTAGLFSLVRVLELVALIVAVLGIVNAQLANVLDRTRELGVLRALGMLQKQVRRMVVVEATLVGALGCSAGLLLGLAFGHLLLEYVNLEQTGWYFPFRLSLTSVIEVVALTLPAAALAGLIPASAAARMRVTQALEAE